MAAKQNAENSVKNLGHLSKKSEDARLTITSLMERLTVLNPANEEIDTINNEIKNQLQILQLVTQNQTAEAKAVCQSIVNLDCGSYPQLSDLSVFLSDMDNKGSNNFYIWTVDFSRKPRGTINKSVSYSSQEFYLNPFGYKAKCTFKDAGNQVFIGIRLVPGKYDDLLSWPFRRIIKLSVLSQVTPSTAPSNPSPSKCLPISEKTKPRDLTCLVRPEENVSLLRHWSKPLPEGKGTPFYIGSNTAFTPEVIFGTLSSDYLSNFVRNNSLYLQVSLIDN